MEYIVWEPSGIIVDLGIYQLRWYSLLFSMGLFIAYLVLKRVFKQNGIADDKFDKFTMFVIIATVLGARLGHCLFYDWAYYQNHLLEIFLPFKFEPEFRFTGFQGLASHGGTIGVLIALIIYSIRYKIKMFWVLDKAALLAPLCAGFIRLGNLMNSEILGKETDVAWAFIFKNIDNVPRHPAQLYEAISYFLIFLILKIVDKKFERQNGFIFGLFFFLLFSARVFIEMFKEVQVSFELDMAMNMGQNLSIPFIIAGLVIMLIRNKKGDRSAY